MTFRSGMCLIHTHALQASQEIFIDRRLVARSESYGLYYVEYIEEALKVLNGVYFPVTEQELIFLTKTLINVTLGYNENGKLSIPDTESKKTLVGKNNRLKTT